MPTLTLNPSAEHSVWSLTPYSVIETMLAFVKPSQSPDVRVRSECTTSTRKSVDPYRWPQNAPAAPNISDVDSISRVRETAPTSKSFRVNLSDDDAKSTSGDNAPRSATNQNSSPIASFPPKSAQLVASKSSGRQILQCSGKVGPGRRCEKSSARSELSDVWFCSVHNPTAIYAAPWYCADHVNQNESKSPGPAAAKDPSLPVIPSLATDENSLNNNRRTKARQSLAKKISLPSDLSEFIPDCFSDDLKSEIRAKLEQPLSKSDKPGFIYVFEITDPNAEIDDYIHLKIGMASDVMSRLKTWEKQCLAFNFSCIGQWQVSYRGRMEQLIHLELDGLAAYFATSGYKGRINVGKCVCGTKHREIFSFRCSEVAMVTHGTRYEGTGGWEAILKGMIERWERFIETYYV
ncbi:hypothetical protein BD410DRAFT_845069 [Rickenella mellea]|uniref:Bacteriophage T5 Orf172 DNA-binding domain-containing protein n=1 Tax=Rickenella mellea TaxID=50990 RepID=A0A4Y7PM07_9AGAM|nr:hypothetical protein BD410DRAFT_845069 [Rickenella mellea]